MREPRRILVVKLSDIGDVLTATPALRAIRETFPTARVDALVPPNSAPVLESTSLINNVLIFDKFRYDRITSALRPMSIDTAWRLGLDLRRQRYDWVVILHHLSTLWGTLKYAALAWSCGAPIRLGLDNGRGWFLTHRIADGGFGARHEVEYWLDVVSVLGAHTDNTHLEITFGPDDVHFARTALKALPGDGPLAVIHTGSGGYSLARRWDAARFAAVGDELAIHDGARIVLVGTALDNVDDVAAQMETAALNLCGRTTVKQLAAVLARCNLFIGVDSGVMHLACAVGVPVVAIFGPSNERAWGPWPRDEKHIVVRASLPCAPCSYVGHGVGHREGCLERACMDAVTTEMVLSAARGLLYG
ncbi:MAG: glycosyltransferase family 9 protein [Chloroflexi bacterium]|nr:glycosyltransferase family 9 protein [Chloroflexota bacterium]